MGCNQSKRKLGEAESMNRHVIWSKSKRKRRLPFYKFFTKRSNKVESISISESEISTNKLINTVSTEEQSAKSSPSDIHTCCKPVTGVQSYQVVSSSNGGLMVVLMKDGPTPRSSSAEGTSSNDSRNDVVEPEEEIFAEGCCYEIVKEDPSLAAGGDTELSSRVITETSATVEEEVDLELNRPPTPEMNVIGRHIQPILTEEQAEEAFRIIGEELTMLKEELRELNEHVDNRDTKMNKIVTEQTAARHAKKTTRGNHPCNGDSQRQERDEDGLPGAVLTRKSEGLPFPLVKTAWE